MTDEEKSKELTRSSFAAQMAMLGYKPNGNPKDMVEVVRCKDCVHWIPGTITDKDDFIQPRCRRNGGGWSADEYCSCAEKRTDEI